MLRKIHKFINEYNGLELSIIKKLLERKYHGIEKIINRYYISVEKLDGMNSVDYMIQFMNGRSFEDVRSHIKHYNVERPLIDIIKSASFSDFMTFCKSYQSSFTGNDSPASYTVAGLARCCPLLNPYLVYIYISTVRLKSDVKKVLTLQEIMQHLEGDSLIQLDLNNQFAVKGESYSLEGFWQHLCESSSISDLVMRICVFNNYKSFKYYIKTNLPLLKLRFTNEVSLPT